MPAEPYATLAEVYEWLIPDTLLTPEGSVAAFAPVIEELDSGARILDCAAGIGQLAVGLALEGFDVTATDASPAMVARTRRLVTAREVQLQTTVCAWDQLRDQGWSVGFDAVFCVGNSLTHAPGQAARRAALGQMAAVLRPGGLLVVTSRNWERVRDLGPGLQIAEQMIERDGRQALVTRAWSISSRSGDPHYLDVSVALIDATGSLTSHVERLPCWPFPHEVLEDDLVAVGLRPASSTYAEAAEWYLVTARAPSA